MAKYELKTKKRKASVAAFINSIKDPERRADAKKVNALMKKITKKTPQMWGTSIVGYGTYHYIYPSGQTGDWMMTAFSPRKANITIYIMPGYKLDSYKALLKKLGPHKTGKSCLYIRRLSDVHEPTLKRIIEKGWKDMQSRYGKDGQKLSKEKIVKAA